MIFLVERAIDELGRAARPARGGREPIFRDVVAADADALRERDEVRREVGARAHAVLVQQRGDHPHRRGLAVRADDVNRGEGLLGRVQRRHQPAHPVQPEAHAEQLE